MSDLWEWEYFSSLSEDASGDPDSDQLSNSQELLEGTNPNLPDTDGDGFLDGFEISTGFDPLSSESTPDTVSFAERAIEFRFNAPLGETFRVEASDDAESWTVIETGIAGNGASISRLYSIQGLPSRYFRAVAE